VNYHNPDGSLTVIWHTQLTTGESGPYVIFTLTEGKPNFKLIYKMYNILIKKISENGLSINDLADKKWSINNCQ